MSRFVFFGLTVLFVVLCFSRALLFPEPPTGKLGLDLTGCAIEADFDTHGGFHGDGERYIRVNCSAEAERVGEAVKAWDPLPLTDVLERVMYDDADGYRLAERFDIPRVTNGYWFLIDRQATGEARYRDSDLLGRGSFNFSVAIYDTDTCLLHYYEIDT